MILFPAIDLKDGQCVRLRQGEMAEATVFNPDPAAQARMFEDQGFDWLHVVDLNGAFEGKPVNEKAVDIAICRRFKLRGMSWYRRGVTHLLRLRLLRLNETWQRYWQALRRRPTALAGSHLTSTDV